MARPRRKKLDGRYADLTCRWFTQAYGEQWERWRAYADEWLHAQDTGLSHRRDAIILFLESYLVGEGLPPDPAALFKPNGSLPSLMTCVEKTHKSMNKSIRHNTIVEFIDWVITKGFSASNDDGVTVPLVSNPFDKVKVQSNTIETVWNPLPYTYIRELRTILCPEPHGCFRDWTWAHAQSGTRPGHRNQGDWFEVAPEMIDEDDADCVWRERALTRESTNITIPELWSPMRAMLLFIKLHLPLRTYQVRMLDSGEADTWRYDQGRWVKNEKHDFVVGSEKAPWQRGVFRRIRVPDMADVMTGLYINTNKSADRNKDALDRGYTIPWQHEEVLYWLEKLRNWQEKYNPIQAPTPWATLQPKHIGTVKSKQALARMGESCFLFRDASAKTPPDRTKPVLALTQSTLWYRLLKALEDRVAARGQTLSDGSRLRFVKQYDEVLWKNKKTGTEFPLHSLRVSLITSFAMDGQVPLPVLSKLLAGHSRILMTVYYTKITPAVMQEKMAEAEAKINAKEVAGLRTFLQDADLHQIQTKTAYRDTDSIKVALANRNPVGWEQRYIGLCLVGGNTVKSDEKGSVGGCWNGGDLIRDAELAHNRLYGSVPHGPENCVRCRWFLTDARYLDALRAHFNNLSYRASQAASQALELEQSLEALQDLRFEAEQEDQPFTQQAALQQAERRYEKQMVEADEYAKDMRACFTLIHRIVSIESGREEDDNRQKLFAVGALHDIHQPIGLVDTQSELWQLAEICEDAEIYPDLADNVRKTPAVEKRSRALNTMLMRDNYAPVFMQMDEHMQLMMGNAFMRAMAKRACPQDWRIEGYRRVTGLIEAGRSLQEGGLLEGGIEALKHRWQNPVLSLNELLARTRQPQLEVVHDDD